MPDDSNSSDFLENVNVSRDILKKKAISHDEHERIVKLLSEEIVRKDSVIKSLQERNKLLLGTTLSQGSKIAGLSDLIKRLNEERTVIIKREPINGKK
jgi:hypothetical protein